MKLGILKSNIPAIVLFIGFFLLIFITAIVLVTALLFFIGVPVSIANSAIGLATATAYVLFIKAPDSKEKLAVILSGTLIILLCVAASTVVYDTTWDGSAYHKQAIGLLKDGWNPYVMSAKEFAVASQSVPVIRDTPLTWTEAYPKATWYYSASLYALTNNIESGKSYNPLFAAITFCLFFGLLTDLTKSSKQSFIVALIAALNPIALSQMQSYYLDGMLTDAIMLMALVLFILSCDYTRRVITLSSRTGLYAVLTMLLFLACNLKFSALVFSATICGVYFLWYCVCRKRFVLPCISVPKLFVFFAVSAIFTVLAVGFAPYVTNTVRYGNPLYSFIKPDGETLFSDSVITSAGGLAELTWQQNFFASFFGKMSHGEYTSLGELLKVPFTFSIDELKYYFYVDTRLSGMGIFFSGIFLISLAVLIIWLVRKRRSLTLPAIFACLLTVVLLIEIIMLPASMQFRYIGFIYLIPVLALSICLYSYNESQKAKKSAVLVLLLVLVANSIPWCLPISMRAREGFVITSQLNSFSQAASSTKGAVTVAIDNPDITGYYYNLRDFGITNYRIADIEQVSDNWFSMYSNFKRDLIYYHLES